MAKLTKNSCCKRCRKWLQPSCDERKANGQNSGPDDYCQGFRKAATLNIVEYANDLLRGPSHA